MNKPSASLSSTTAVLPAAPLPVDPTLKTGYGIATLPSIRKQLDKWAALDNAARGDVVTQMVEALLDAGWAPGDIVRVKRGRR